MKKYIFSVLALAATLVGCTGDYKDWADPQATAQEQTVTFGNGSVTEVGLIDFASDAVASSEQVQVCTIVAPTATDTTYKTKIYKLNLTASDGVVTSYDVTADGKMSTSDLKNFLETSYGKAPTQREVAAKVEQWISNGTTVVKTTTSSYFHVKAKLVAPNISENYYVVGGTLDWKTSCQTKEQKFTHSATNVYDDPVFTITIPASETGDTWFAIGDDEALDAVANNDDWSKLLGTTGESTDLTGMLKTRTELGGDHSLCVPNGPKFLKITINMMDGTYSIEKVSYQPYIYYVGTANGWNNSADGVSQKLVLSDQNTGTYSGYIYCKEESYGNTFRFFKVYNSWDSADGYGNSDITSYDGPMEAGSSDNNFNATAGSGVYYVEMCLSTGTFKAVKVDKMGIIGNFNGWGGDVDMTWDADNFCYVASNPGVTADGWKFRVNGGWDYNLGGKDLLDLTNGGDNLTAVGNTIKLYPCRTTSNNIYCTVE